MSTHILILDDDPDIIEILTESLASEDYVCISVETAADALAHLRERSFDILIADVVLGESSGIEVAREAKTLQPEIVIVVMTGTVGIESAIEALRLGADEYILKPFRLSEFTVAIERGLEKRELIRKVMQHERDLEERVAEATRELQESHLQLVETEKYLSNLLNSTVDAIITVNNDDIVTFANRGAQQMLGYRQEEFLNVRFDTLLGNGGEGLKYLRRVLEIDRPLQNFDTELRKHDGSLVPASISFSLATDAHGNAVSLVAICKDVTAQKKLEADLKEMSIRDSLTGMFNVRYFYERLDMEIDRAKRQRRELSLLLVDVDKFKSYNDSRGHLEGDNVLAEVGRVIAECTRENVDMGFRYGGDEFTILLPEAGEKQARRVANRIVETFESRKFDLLTLSLGQMTYDGQCSSKDFMRYTDSMMYDAKRAGGNQVYVYSPGSNQELESGR